jgi:pimeloyl-ACP methyl ester carboxylesterase
MHMSQVELSSGPVEYTDSGGDGRTVLFLHGLLMDSSLWDAVIADLAVDHRCVAPTLPMGAHRLGARHDADLSLPGLARLVAELIEHLDLRDVTVVGNDTGGALVQLLVTGGDSDRVAAIVLVSCDAFDNLPPGLTGKTLALTGKLPPSLFGLFMQQMRIRPVRRLPIAFGWLTKRGDKVTRRWMTPILKRREIRRDTVRVLRAFAADDHLLVDAAERLPGFDRPALVVWASDDKVMPLEHGWRLADLFPKGQLVEIADSFTLIPLDQPDELARSIRHFLSDADGHRPSGPAEHSPSD